MSGTDEPDLRFSATLLNRLVTDVASLKDDMTVLSAIAMRQDHTLAAVLTEVRAMHAQHGRLAGRVRQLEDAASQKDAP